MNVSIEWVLFPALIVALTLHECAHAWSASLLGDEFARRQGRVSLWPGRHLSMMGTLAFFVLRFGWGKPVPVNLYNFKHPKRDYLLTSLAGPVANVLTIGVCMLLMRLTRRTYAFGPGGEWAMELAHLALSMLALISAILATINLLPVPPLDGSKIWPCIIPGLKPTLKPRTTWLFVGLLLFLVYTNSLSPIFATATGVVMDVLPVSDAQRVDDLVLDGYRAIDKARELTEKKRDAAVAWARAEASLTEALEICPYRGELYSSRAVARMRLGRPDEAMEDVRRALEITPRDAEALWCRSEVHLATGRPDEALTDIEQAIEIDPDCPIYYETRAGALDALTRPDEARMDRARALKLRVELATARRPRTKPTGAPTTGPTTAPADEKQREGQPHAEN